MKKKVVILLWTKPEWGGAHRYALTLAECIEQCEEDIEFMAICSNSYWRSWCKRNKIRILDVSWPGVSEKKQYYHVKYPLFSRVYTMYMTAFGKMIREEGIDAVLCTTQCTFTPNLNIKIIVPVHDLMHRYERKFPEVASEYESRETLFSSNARYAWCILTDSEIGKRQFVESYARYMRGKNSYVVKLPFVVGEHIVEGAEEYIDVPAKYVFYPAQFWKHKNHLNLIKAIELLVKDIPDVRLLLVGSERNSRREMEQYIASHGLTDNILIKGFVSDGNVIYLYKHATAMIMPSYFGPTNIPPLEAMMLGCPVAVSNKYAMPEQVGDAGLLFDPDSPKEIAECIRKLWENEELRQDMIKKGYQQIKKFSMKNFNRRFQAIMKKI